jgi:hypothetical protein
VTETDVKGDGVKLSIFVLAGALIGTAMYGADDPFVGKWVLDKKATQLAPIHEGIEDLGGNRFKIVESNGTSINTVVADGTDQPANFGRTLSIKPQSEKAWRVVWKVNDRVQDEAVWAVSPDGQTLTMIGTAHFPGGGTNNFHRVWKRLSGTDGFVGTWEDVDPYQGSVPTLELRPYDNGGLSFYYPRVGKVLQNIKFDGKEYPDLTDASSFSTSSGKRTNSHAFHIDDKFKGEVVDTQEFSFTPDGKTLTVKVTQTKNAETDVFVYNRVNSFPNEKR